MGSLLREIPHAEEPAKALDPLNLLVWPKGERFSVREVRMPSTEEEDAVHKEHTGHGAKKLRWEWLWPPRIDHVHGLQPEGPRARSSDLHGGIVWLEGRCGRIPARLPVPHHHP